MAAAPVAASTSMSDDNNSNTVIFSIVVGTVFRSYLSPGRLVWLYYTVSVAMLIFESVGAKQRNVIVFRNPQFLFLIA